MSNERQRIRAIAQLQSSRPQFSTPSVSIEELYRDLDEEQYTRKLCWLEIQLKTELDNKDSNNSKNEAQYNKAQLALKFIKAFFLYEHDGFDPKTLKSIEKELFLQTTPSDPEKEYNQLYHDISCLLSELESEKQIYVNADDLNARNVLTPVISLAKQVLCKGTDSAKFSLEKANQFESLNSGLAAKELEITSLKEEIERLKNTSQSIESPLMEQRLPSRIKIAISTFIECWDDLPEDMKRPLTPDIEEYIRSMGIIVGTEIDRIKLLSVADNENLGGHPKSSQVKPWKQKKYR